MLSAFTKIFGSKNDRELKKLWPIVSEINSIYDKFDLSEEEILKKSLELREYINGDPTKLDEIMPEAFALAKYAAKKMLGKKYTLVGNEIEWNMVPFDVQLIGAIALHKGKVGEMATGEGKTLVATLPLYLNALVNPKEPVEGRRDKGVHLVTVNDYLAKRDMEWMRPLFEMLGVTTGVILGQMSPAQRREAYAADITYGTNNEFGFDYLRDNMAVTVDGTVQIKEHFFSIVDEVDSVLIDEARTPLIISGPVEVDSHKFNEVRPLVQKLSKAQTLLVSKMVTEAVKDFEEENDFEAGRKLLLANRGGPKNRQLQKVFQESAMKRAMRQVENEYLRDKKMHVLDEQLFFVIEEKNNVVSLTDKGRNHIAPNNPEYYILPDLAEEFSEIEGNETLSIEEKLQQKQKFQQEFNEKNEINHNIQQLLKAYMLFEKDVDYVVTDGKVMIVDEFTGRIMHGRRYSDGLHQALEAKEDVKIERETQTFATITLQNYYRMYKKLAGMTGTAITEAQEFWDIYKLDVIQMPTNRPIKRMDYDDRIYRTKKAKYIALIDETERLYRKGKPVLVGTISVETSEMLSRLLKRKKVPHKVLNAKYHQQEAEIVSKAGQPGAITIATNMAGRGTDIKLGAGVIECDKKCYVDDKDGDTPPEGVDLKECERDMLCGLHIIGTERHEARRIDLQLKGRAGRQGDPGSSRFYLSLEDDLMRLFAPDRILNVLDRLGASEEDVITHPMITRSLEKAQKKVEAQNYAIRKRLLEYDDVMNKQREIIYQRRNIALRDDDVRDELHNLLDEYADIVVEEKLAEPTAKDFDLVELNNEVLKTLYVNIMQMVREKYNINSKDYETEEEEHEALIEKIVDFDKDEFHKKIVEQAWNNYQLKLKILPEKDLKELEKHVMLRVLDEEWKDHLYEMDLLKEGIHLRAYGQKDPLVEYKRESFGLFEDLIEKINRRTLEFLWNIQPVRESELFGLKPKKDDRIVLVHSDATNMGFQGGGEESSMAQAAEQSRGKNQPVHVEKKTKPNEPCPCGSGKKYKKCHGATVRV